MDLKSKTKAELIELIQKERATYFVYPNVNELSQHDELKYSLRSLEKNYQGNYKVVIVGEMPTFINDKVLFIDVPHTGKSPREDVATKRICVDTHKHIPEEYYWMNDDIYFVNPVTREDLGIPTVICDLDEGMSKYDKQTPWGKDMHKTYEYLCDNGYPTLNYATHVPHKIRKSIAAELNHSMDLVHNPHVFENLYYNIHFQELLPYWLHLDHKNNLLFSVNRPNPDWHKVDEQLLSKKFMNNGEAGMSEDFIALLERLFPDKSPFEV